MTRFAFMDTWRKTFPISRMCKVLEVSARGYRAWRTRPMSQRQRDDMVLLAHKKLEPCPFVAMNGSHSGPD